MRSVMILGYVALLYFGLFIANRPAYAAVQNATVVPNTTVKPQPRTVIRDDDDDDDDFVPYMGERFTNFDWTLFRTIGKRHSGNLLISPISLKLALVLLYEGAQDQTAHELAEVLQLPPSRSATREKFTTALQSLQTYSPEYTLNLGTRLYIDAKVLVRQRYGAIAKTFYGADVVTTNMTNSHKVTEEVNAWVSNVTNARIPKMIEDEGSIRDSVMLIMNALFFKGNWRRRYFQPEDTAPGKFYTSANQTVDALFMHTTGRFYYSESAELDAKILRIPYQGHKFAMYLILPYTITGADHLMKEINPFVLTRHVWLMQDLPVDVLLPKFKFDFSSHLENTLRELGIRDVFDNTATLTGIARTKRTSSHLQVSDILQKTGIEVNENGTSAYAAVEVQLGNKIEEETFHADRPFVFYIEDESTGTILYIGKLANPLETVSSMKESTPDIPSRFGEGMQSTGLSGVPSSEERFNFFNVDLLQALKEEHEDNLIMSPASVKIALMTLTEGTGGRTRDELLSALRLPAEDLTIRTLASRTVDMLQKNENGTEIDTSTRLWARRGLEISTSYRNILRHYYNGDLQSVDFDNTENAVRTVNDWVRRVTKEKIQSVIDTSSLHPDTQLLLTSALYFKGQWMKSFDKNSTRHRCFNVPNVGCQSIPFMQATSQYRYAYVPSLDAEVLEIPYSDGKTSMLILLPSNGETEQSLRVLAKDLSYAPISALLGILEDTEVFLTLPKFSIESKLDLRPSLERMGIRNVFSFSANLTGIVAENSLRVSSVIQNAKIEVDENGTIAVAVTGIGIVPLMGTEVQNFQVNRPFIFMIVDLQTKGTLFSGWVINPASNNLNIK